MKRIWGELAFAAGLAAIVWLVLHFGLNDVLRALASVGPAGFAAVALAHLPTLIVLGLSWWLLSRDAPGAQPFKFIWGRWVRDAGGDVLPLSHLGGYLLGARAVSLTGVPGVTAAASGLLDLFVEQVAKIPYTIAAVALLLWLAPGSDLVIPALVVLVLSIGMIVGMVWRRHWIRERLANAAVTGARTLPGFASADPGEMRLLVGAALAPAAGVWPSVLLHLLGWVLGAAETWIALYVLHAPVSFAAAVVIDGLFVTVRMFAFFVPAAVGVQETAYVVLAGLFGVAAPTAVALSLVRRGRDLIVGAPAVILWQLAERRRRQGRAEGAAVEAR